MSTDTANPTSTHWFSLRRALLWPLLGGLAVAWSIAIALSWLDAHHEIDEIFDARLAQSAQSLLALTPVEPGRVRKSERRAHHDDDDHDDDDRDERTMAMATAHHPYQTRVAFRLWRADGQLLLRSEDAPAMRFDWSPGFREGSDGWRYFALRDADSGRRVVVGEQHAVRDQLIRSIARRLILPAALTLPLLGLWLWWVTRRALSSIGRLTDEVARRAPDRLDPLSPQRAPKELRPLLDALNRLLRRLDTALTNERRFTADAAHELRTPLAALATQATVAARARDEAERAHALRQIELAAGRAGHLVDQLLMLARLDPATSIAMVEIDLRELAREVCAEHGPQALAKGIELELAADAVTVIGATDLLRVLLRNLIDNALRYTPEHGRVLVTLERSAGARLTVADSGPGIPPAQRADALRRFHRLAGQESEGSGLGLSIVDRIAEQHGGHLMLDASALGGLAAIVSLPAKGPVAS